MTEQTADADLAARADIADRLHTTLFVGAGAGSGKTTSLVGRIVRLVIGGGVAMRQIAAITFTEAAAAELRDRVREALEQLAAGRTVPGTGPGGAPVVLDEGDRALADAALADLDLAAISTLHGFAQRILVAHAIEAGLPPRLTVLDELSSQVAFEQRWSAFLTRLLDQPAGEEIVVRARLCGITLAHLRSIAATFNQNWDLVADHTPPPLGPPLAIIGSRLRQMLDDALAHEDECTADDDKLLTHLRGLHTFADTLRDCPDGLPLLKLLQDAPKIASRVGQKGNWPDVGLVRDLLAEAHGECERIRTAVARDALQHLVVELRRLTLDAVEDRRRAGTLEYHDLLVRARDLVRARPEVCRALQTRWTHLLIDEFQDTDPIQAELAFRIAGDPGDADPADWRSFAVSPGSLFFVGDPKQAIYRFRRADIQLYLDLQALVTDVGDHLELTRCFRSVPSVVGWVNEVFGRLIGDGDGNRQPPYAPLVATRDAHDDASAVRILGGPVAKDQAPAIGDVRQLAATDIARTIRAALHEAWPVGREGRPIRLADIALLIPTSTELASLEEALEAHDLPYRVETASLIFATPEITDLLNALRAVADPSDDLSVVAALRSPLYACGDDDLVAWKLGGGRWNPTRVGEQAEGPVAEGLRHLHALHRDLRTSDPGTIVERLLADRRALALTLDLQRPRDVWRRLRWVADQARAFTEQGGPDLRAWLAWMDALATDNVKVKDAILPESDDDAVRILTMHGSKGLEFPMVVVCGLLSKGGGNNQGPTVLWGSDGPELAVKDLTTVGYDALAADEEILAAHERTRLLYVAATRAQDHLILPLHHQADSTCPAATLWNLHHDPDLTASAQQYEPPADLPARPAAATIDLPPAATPDDRHRWIEQWTDERRRLRHPRVVSATRVARADNAATGADTPDQGAEEVSTEQPAWRRGRGGTAVGRAVHATLQLVDLTTQEGLEDIARFQAEAEEVADQHRDVLRLARHALDSELVREAARSPHWRETYVGVPVGDRVLEGFIDLLIEGPDGFTVVDYKTALGADDAEVRRRADAQRAQAAAYAVAVERLTGRPVVRCAFLFLREHDAVTCDVTDLAAAKALVPDLVAGA